MDIVCRWPGSTHDSRISHNSSVKIKFEDRRLKGILLGDRGTPSYPICIHPFKNMLFTQMQKEGTNILFMYNRAHKRTINLVERLFGVWKQRFPCLRLILRNRVRTTAAIIVACAVLHNIGMRHIDHVDGILLEVMHLFCSV
ncbi:hypothetical protein PR048_002839, partial [Dryococelus australis]